MTNPEPRDGIDSARVVAMFEGEEPTDDPGKATRIEVEETADDGSITSTVFIS
jgi:hypothetical protein